MSFTRYAIYILPDGSDLAQFGTRWLGWDARAARTVPPPDLPDLPLPWDQITEAPRKYGFHGTIKPPFRLAPDASEEDLSTALAEFCARRAPVSLDGLELAALGRFLALIPSGGTLALKNLAADAVRDLDRFRAPLTQNELSRRRQTNLTDRQEALLQDWGYPYVMDEFRFHLTLSAKLPKAKTQALYAALMPCLQPMLRETFVIDALSLMGERPDGRFLQIGRFPLSGR